MQMSKISKIGMSLAMALIAITALCISVLCYTNDKSITSQAAVDSVSVTFAGFPDTIQEYCVVTFFNVDGNTVNAVLTTNGTFSLGNAIGKLEVTVPMYTSITAGLPSSGVTKNGSTYYIDISSSTTLTNLTITYQDMGYFGSTVVL